MTELRPKSTARKLAPYAVVLVPIALWALGLRSPAARAQEPASKGEKGEKAKGPLTSENEVWLTSEQEEALGIRTEAAPLKKGDHPIITGGKVSLDLEHTARIRPLLNSTIYEVKKRAGDEVKKGDELLVVESTDLGDAKNNYLTALANLEVAAETYKREALLRVTQATTETDYHNARAGFMTAVVAAEAAREKCLLLGVRGVEIAALEQELPVATDPWDGREPTRDDVKNLAPPTQAQREDDALAALTAIAHRRVHRTTSGDDDTRRRARFTIRAPIDGTLLTRDAARGELIDPSQVIATVSDLAQLWINIDIYQTDIGKVRIGARVDIDTPTYRGVAFVGSVTFLAENVDDTTHTLKARVVVDNPRRLLKSGMAAKTTIHCVDEEPKIELPPQAIVRDAEGTFVVIQGGKRTDKTGLAQTRYEKRRVQLGLEAEDAVHVDAGVQEGERVVLEGNLFIHTKITLGD
jgi:cobalt-zinc-cadmium efflux system membrane fusion protein